MLMNQIHLNHIISEDLAGFRLDQALAKLFPQFSRSQIQYWIEHGEVLVDQKKILKSKERVFPGQLIELIVTLEDKDEWQPENIPLDILYEDESLLIINKPAGLVVHPGAGNPKSTLVNALLHYDPGLKKVPRAGLIHRLDKDTSGLLLVARTLTMQHFFSQQMQQREIQRIYVAIVTGQPRPAGTIDLAIGRHPTQRTKMAISNQGKPAKTHYQLLEKFKTHSYLEIKLETGRTHQIRVHMAHLNHPILGDPLYGKSKKFANMPDILSDKIAHFTRQALHAKKLIFTHPISGELLTFEAPLPADFEDLLNSFRKFSFSQSV